jgi:hypothetical protein
MSLKKQILEHYQLLLQDKIDVFRDLISNLTIDSQNDAKGSAGDKHETALAMMHLEQEKLNYKLKEIYQQKAVLDKIDPNVTSLKIGLGSIVKTNGMLLFISAALPKINCNQNTIIAVSPQSPLGSKLIGNSVGFSFQINSTNYIIELVE